MKKVYKFKNEKEVLSSDDTRISNQLKMLFGKASHSSGCSFKLSLDGAKQVVKILEAEKLTDIWGRKMTADFDNVMVSYLELVGNGKLFLVIDTILPKSNKAEA